MAVTLITGAGSGIGAATAAVFAERGGSVACVDQDFERARHTAATIGDAAIAVQADVTDPVACDEAVASTVAAFGDIHHVVTCAGVDSPDAASRPI